MSAGRGNSYSGGLPKRRIGPGRIRDRVARKRNLDKISPRLCLVPIPSPSKGIPHGGHPMGRKGGERGQGREEDVSQDCFAPLRYCDVDTTFKQNSINDRNKQNSQVHLSDQVIFSPSHFPGWGKQDKTKGNLPRCCCPGERAEWEMVITGSNCWANSQSFRSASSGTRNQQNRRDTVPSALQKALPQRIWE